MLNPTSDLGKGGIFSTAVRPKKEKKGPLDKYLINGPPTTSSPRPPQPSPPPAPLPLVCSGRQELLTATVDRGPSIVIAPIVSGHGLLRGERSMPGLGATDPADLEAQARAELGFSRQLEQTRRVAPSPRFGGSCGYPVWY
jgi:hypothetical protein